VTLPLQQEDSQEMNVCTWEAERSHLISTTSITEYTATVNARRDRRRLPVSARIANFVNVYYRETFLQTNIAVNVRQTPNLFAFII